VPSFAPFGLSLMIENDVTPPHSPRWHRATVATSMFRVRPIGTGIGMCP
jgi:hypothetical protein